VATPDTEARAETRDSVELRDAENIDRHEWEELADRSQASPFSHPGWIDPYWRAFGRGRPVALVARRQGRLVGLLPLDSRRGVLASATNWQTPLFGPVVEDADAAAALGAGVLAHARRRADLWFLDPVAPGLEQARAAAETAGWKVIERTMAEAPYVPVEGSFEDFTAGLERKFRKDIGRRWRRLEDRGEVDVAFEDGSENLEELLDVGFRLEGSGWKTEAGTAIASDPVREGFYRDVCRWAAARGWLTLAFLRVDGRPLAFDLCLELGGVCYVLKGGFDVEERRLGPGVLLTHASIRRSFELGFSSYELLGQADDYKLSWTSATRPRMRLQLFPRSLAGSLEHLAWRRARPLYKRVQELVTGQPRR
jgi:CelD/BcsL family acetyltransferase involved in cellulose biosynthesis